MKSGSPLAHTFTGHLETSLACRDSPEVADLFLDQLHAELHGIKRYTLSKLFQLASNYPELTATLIGRRLPAGTSYAGVGRWSIFYCQNDTVIKVFKDTLHRDETSRRRIASEETVQHNVVRDYLSSIVVPQTISVAPHPVNPRYRAVQIRQQYYNYHPLDNVFSYHQPAIDETALQSLFAVAPNLREAFYNFACGGLRMMAETPYAPDISGRGNIGIVSTPGEPSRLILADGQPGGVTNDWVQQYVKPQLEHLQQVLDPVHAV